MYFYKKRKMMKIFIFTFMHEIYGYFYEFEREATCRRHILTFVMDECERKQILYCTFNNNKKITFWHTTIAEKHWNLDMHSSQKNKKKKTSE